MLNDPPYGTERSYNALRLALAMAKRDRNDELTVFLLADAVFCAHSGQKTPDGYYNIERMLKGIGAGGRVLVCGTCMEARGLSDDGLVRGAARSTMAELAQATAEADRVLVF
jgi:uncharacterized protein involved in oxidation of intracellular sulfur